MTGVNPSFDDLRKMTLEFAKENDFPNDNKEKSFGNLPLADTPLPKGKA